ncbi:hypothetical protein L873DRAFT_1802508 [Choiromyces venosus 120613-1]|uniref:Uncharacterized protein n=1 Tax=Choiromyces venosus 120613-1 TaxID=1336337 RepID=A0A3N4JXW7_9PEZI|nr:hypothetical protein L873DRAFT_1802508 [Choiromyces venosus 120613-1]
MHWCQGLDRSQLANHVTSNYTSLLLSFDLSKAGRSPPKLTQFESQSCSPPSALCGGDSQCFARWHNLVHVS